MKVLFSGVGGAFTHEYPADSNWLTGHHNFIQIVDGSGKELAVYDRGSIVCIRHDAAEVA